MKTLTIPVNARNGSIAEDVLGTELKRQLRPSGTLHAQGFRQFDIAGFTRPGPDLPFDKVAAQEIVRDESRLHTYVVHVTLYTEAEAQA